MRRFVQLWLVLLTSQLSIAQVNVYECDPSFALTSEQDINSAVYHLHKPCIVMDNEPYEIDNNYPKYITARESIHVKAEYGNERYFHAGPQTGTDHFWMRIQDQESPYEVWALNYDDLSAIQRYKKLELGIKLEGDLLDRINDFLHSAAPQANAINPFLEWELDINVKFVHNQTLTEKWMDGFYYQDYNRNTDPAVNDWEAQPTDFPMRVRFAPPLNGLWNAYVSITYDNNTMELPVFSFNVVESGHPGYVSVHPNKRNLQRGGEVIFPIGHAFPGPYNRAPGGVLESKMPWGDPPSSNKNANPRDWEAYIGDIESYISQGAKSFKMVQTSYGNLIEFEELGNYYNRLHYAWEQDEILELCEENDVLINFNLLFQDVIMAFGQNGGDQINLGWCTGWAQDPWDYGNYGADGLVNACDYFPTYCYFEPGTKPSSMFFDTNKMEYHKQRTRYYVARYGYSPQIYTWELMSEPLHMDEFTYGAAPAQDQSDSGFANAIGAVNLYHDVISHYIKNELHDQDHLIAMDVAPMSDIEDIFTSGLSCVGNANIDILGFNQYSYRPDKWVVDKEENDNGLENIEFGNANPGELETSTYKSIHFLQEWHKKPIIFSEVGHGWEANCMGVTGNVIDAMTGGFCGVAAMHPWSGYSYGAADEIFDERNLWSSTIAAEKHMNSDKVTPVLQSWSGNWVQGRQVQEVFNNNDENPKELQYYIAESNESVTGYVRNTSWNVWTNRVGSDCGSLVGSPGFLYPLTEYYPFLWNFGPNNLFVYPLEPNTYHTIRWYAFPSGVEYNNQTYKSRLDGRFKMKYPALDTPSNSIHWFTIEKSDGNRIQETIISGRSIDVDEDQFTLFPNPFSDEINIHSPVLDEYEILSSNGQILKKIKSIGNETKLKVDDLPPGIYIIKSVHTCRSYKLVKL